jgi:hypothetical protein
MNWKNAESVGAIERRRPAIEHTSTRAPKLRSERTCAHACKKKIDRICDQVHMACDQEHLCVKIKLATALFWKVLLLGFFVQQGRNPTIFRVSRASLDFINKLVNIEKHTRDFGEEFMILKEAIFRVYSFPLFYFMKMINIKFMCN